MSFSSRCFFSIESEPDLLLVDQALTLVLADIQLGRYGRNRTNVWEYPSINSASRSGEEGNLLALHPTVKPVALVADALLDCSAREDLVLDAFLGSGSTLIAAERTGRICCGIELDPLYVDTAIKRWVHI
jgi:DNA modification methylase